MRTMWIASLTTVFSLLSGCASTPKGSTSYYFPKAETQLIITQTLSCNARGDKLRELVTVTPTTAYTSDLSVPPAVFEPRSIDGTIADASVALTFTDDGRLAGINTTTTGQGATIVKDIIGVAKAAGVAAAAGPTDIYNPKAACATIKAYTSKDAGGKPADGKGGDARKADAAGGASEAPVTVTLTYARTFQYGKNGPSDPHGPLGLKETPDGTPVPSLPIKPDAGSMALYNELLHNIPRLGFVVEIAASAPTMTAARWSNASGSDAVRLTLNSVATATLAVQGPVGDLQGQWDVIWKAQVPVPLTAKEDLYDVPIPKAALFGTQKFSLALSSYGSINKLEYSKGISDALDAANAASNAFAGALKKPTAAEQAASLQAQADLIYQQQRLAVCEAEPAKCTGK